MNWRTINITARQNPVKCITHDQIETHIILDRMLRLDGGCGRHVCHTSDLEQWSL